MMEANPVHAQAMAPMCQWKPRNSSKATLEPRLTNSERRTTVQGVMMAETAILESQLEMGVAKRSLNVLILDEDPEAALLLRRYLKTSVWFEAELAEARTGKEGLALLESSNFDCVFLDHRLPDGDSTLWLEALSVRYPLLPIILTPSQSNETIAVDALKRGAWDYLAKS